MFNVNIFIENNIVYKQVQPLEPTIFVLKI